MTSSNRLVALLHHDAQDAARVEARSPAVACFRARVRPGEVVQAGQLLGELDVLNERRGLILPPDAPPLRVVEVIPRRGWNPVDWGAPLIHLQPASLGDAADTGAAGAAASVALGLPPGARPFTSPTDGQFYLRPSPDDPPFIKEGATLRFDQIVGLVEVMKFFYEVQFQLPGFEQGARVLRIVAHDATPVESGDVLFYVEPL